MPALAEMSGTWRQFEQVAPGADCTDLAEIRAEVAALTLGRMAQGASRLLTEEDLVAA